MKGVAMPYRKFLVIGEVFVDFHLDKKQRNENLVRLGGIFHALRALSALEMKFSFAYYAPTYLKNDINRFGKNILGANEIYSLGIIDSAPNIFLIDHSDESEQQIYTNILCQQAVCNENFSIENILNSCSPTDILVFPGRFKVDEFLNRIDKRKYKIHIDVNYDSDNISILNGVQTVFLSTSTDSYKKLFQYNTNKELINTFSKCLIRQLIVKENRGGSWGYDFSKDCEYEASAQICDKSTISVGVGDVFNVAYLCELFDDNSNNLAFASWVAAEYAQVFDFDEFKQNVMLIKSKKENFVALHGVRVPWFTRPQYPIYMAAPDFNYINNTLFDNLIAALKYHHFIPRLPIRENGQISNSSVEKDKEEVYFKDLNLLDACKLMIASLLTNDQGTLVEIGYYKKAEKPIILFDPYNIASNMFLDKSCDYYCHTINDVINAVFFIINRMIHNG